MLTTLLRVQGRSLDSDVNASISRLRLPARPLATPGRLDHLSPTAEQTEANLIGLERTPLLRSALVGVLALGLSVGLSAQAITSTSDQTLVLTVPFGAMTPGTSTTPASAQVQFRIRNASTNGYRVTAITSFSPIPTTGAAGGATITASDVGIGITSVAACGAVVITPRTDTVASGFDYNPAAVTASNGLTPYDGTTRRTLAELASATTILSGPKIGNNELTILSNNCLLVTMTFGVLPQYFTPASMTATLTLTISNQ